VTFGPIECIGDRGAWLHVVPHRSFRKFVVARPAWLGEPTRGYAVAVAVNGVLLVLVNAVPGWRAVPFITAEAVDVIFLVNLSLIVGIVVNSLNAVFDRRWLRAAGELASSGVALVMLIQVWRVFPFEFADPAVDWALILRVVIAFAIGGCIASMIVQLVILSRIGIGRPTAPGPART
jgi:hypothetical protein